MRFAAWLNSTLFFQFLPRKIMYFLYFPSKRLNLDVSVFRNKHVNLYDYFLSVSSHTFFSLRLISIHSLQLYTVYSHTVELASGIFFFFCYLLSHFVVSSKFHLEQTFFLYIISHVSTSNYELRDKKRVSKYKRLFELRNYLALLILDVKS